ncbi:MAG: hypothetical protein AMXMBFR82_11370 [Candidatus Hydrogenedentota bacterium]
MPSNPQFDVEYWCKQFPASGIGEGRHPTIDKYYRGRIASPRSMALNAHIRKELWPELDPVMGVPTDLFVWALGEGENPAGTRIGGMPYLPRAIDWPTSDDGAPKEFIAQFNLADSTDILPKLPGDLLLIFCDTVGYESRPRVRRKESWKNPLQKIRSVMRKNEPPKPGPTQYYLEDHYAFVWVDTAQYGPKDIRAREEAPDLPFYLRPLHGQIVRSSDHQDLYEAYCEEKEAFAKKAKQEHQRTRDPNEKTELPGFLKPILDQLDHEKNVTFVDSDAWKAKAASPAAPWDVHYSPPAVLDGTKLGGVPVWEQGHSFTDWGKQWGQPGGPHFIGQLQTDFADMEKPYPYVGRAEPYASAWDERYYQLIIADAGALYLFWDGEKILFEIQGG